ncbi:sigma-70 family RNA polymerase sigma factor, partial [Bacteroides acidifaciens]
LEVLLSIAIEKMPPQRKRIFQMSRKKGMNNEEIANELHISKRTVENHLTQALKDIRKIISLLILIIH